jgi:hypothetical protein
MPVPANDPAASPQGGAPLPAGERALEAGRRERRRVRRLLVLAPLLVLCLAAAVLAVLWRGAVAEGRRLREQALGAERDRAEAERQRDRALAAEAEAGRARAEAEEARRRVAAVQYARTVQLAHQAWGDQNADRTRELLEGIPPEPRGWEWRYLWRPPAPPPRAKD